LVEKDKKAWDGKVEKLKATESADLLKAGPEHHEHDPPEGLTEKDAKGWEKKRAVLVTAKSKELLDVGPTSSLDGPPSEGLLEKDVKAWVKKQADLGKKEKKAGVSENMPV